MRFFGAAAYLAALMFAFRLAEDWTQSFLFLVSLSAGLTSGRWWSVALGALGVPVAALPLSGDYGGDSISGPFDAALFAALFVALPLAVSIAVGVVIRRLARLRRGRRTMAGTT